MTRILSKTGLVAAIAMTAMPLKAAEIEIEADGPVIELSIYESVTVEPDIATIGAGVNAKSSTAVEAMRLNAIEMRKVIDAIVAMGIDEDDIQTTGVNLRPDYEFNNSTRQSEFRGYDVSNRVSVKLREIEQTGEVLDALVAAGATDLSGPSFSIDDDETAKREARSRAIQRGRERVTEYAAMLGLEEFRVLEISEAIQGRGPVYPMAMRSVEVAEAAMSSPPVQPGQVSTGVSITIKYELLEDDEGDEEGESEE